MTPLISIIMPMRNASLWVKETIESIQNQETPDWELIIVDDHSTDHSFAMVQAISLEDTRIHLFKNPEKGIISALQFALNQARGTYLTRMDADDIMPPNRLTIMFEKLQVLPEKSIVTGKVKYFSETEVSAGYLKYEQWLNDRIDRGDFYNHIYRECIVASPNWMGRTEEFKLENLFAHLNYPEDYDLCFHWQEKGFAISGLNEITLQWREHPLRTSRNSAHYQQEAFFKMKMYWFAKNHATAKSIGIVGMGQKGKLCLHYLNADTFEIRLFDLNHTQFSQKIEGKQVESTNSIDTEIVLVARYPNDIQAVQQFIEKKGYRFGKNAYWV